MLWNLLIDKNAKKSNSSDQTDSHDDIEGNDRFEEREWKESFSPFPTVMCDADYKELEPTVCKVLQHTGVNVSKGRSDYVILSANLAID